jgi:hypothetical protein
MPSNYEDDSPQDLTKSVTCGMTEGKELAAVYNA